MTLYIKSRLLVVNPLSYRIKCLALEMERESEREYKFSTCFCSGSKIGSFFQIHVVDHLISMAHSLILFIVMYIYPFTYINLDF